VSVNSRLACLLLVSALVGCAAQRPAPSAPLRDWRVKRAVFVEEKLWVLSDDVDGGGLARVHPLPQQFRTVGFVKVSFDVPGFVVVMTNVGKRPSPVGSAALLVPR